MKISFTTLVNSFAIVYIKAETNFRPGTSKNIINRNIARFIRPLSITLFSVGISVPKSNAASPTNELREQIANTVSLLPGYGQPNLFYPKQLEGFWNVTKIVNDVTESSSSMFSTIDILRERQKLDNPINYIEHYISHEDHIVLDRSYSVTSYYRNLYQDSNIITNWDIVNPNVLTITSPNFKQAIRITKRSSEPQTAETKDRIFGTSEYALLSESPLASLSPPKVYGIRNLVRCQLISPMEAVGVERIFVYSSDTIDASDSKPVAVVKTRFTMQKLFNFE